MSTSEKPLPPKPSLPSTASEETATRCPFCHDACSASEDVRVCSLCLTRHHADCWSEGHGCGSCGATEPLARVAEGQETPGGIAGFFAEHKHVLLRWELLRIPYNLVLFGVSAVMLGSSVLSPSYFLDGVAAALIANVCYCLGPGLEVYLRTLGAKQKWIGPLLFGFGLLLSMIVTAMACLIS